MGKKKKLGSVFDFACGSGSLILNVRNGIKMHFFGWICLSENAPLIGQRIAMRNIKFVVFHPVQQHIHSC
jgi:hypothetical protein